MITDSPQNEYWFHVAKQDEIPIAGDIDKSVDISKLVTLLKGFSSSKEHEIYLQAMIMADAALIDILRTLVGVSDKRMYLELSYLFSKTKSRKSPKENILGGSFFDLQKHTITYFKNLTNSKDQVLAQDSVKLIVSYLIDKGLLEILLTMSKLSYDEIDILIEKLVITKEVQQAQAKRRGHGAEFELAKLLNTMGCKILPEDRYKVAIGSKDPNVDSQTFEVRRKEKGKTWSFDLIITHDGNPTIYIQSLIHTSDPGQYGVNKSDETVLIKNAINKHNEQTGINKELWGLVDGVGFCENKKDTIDKMLTEFDCFIQLKTLYKAGLRLHKLGIIQVKAILFDTSVYSEEMVTALYKKYVPKDIILLSKISPIEGRIIRAGCATLII